MKARDKKGFTLIEVIVVLVILAILAAIAIPALTGYIDKANQRAAISQAGVMRTSLQSIASESYTTPTGTGNDNAFNSVVYPGSATLGPGGSIPGYSPITTAESKTIAAELTALTGITVADSSLKNIHYKARVLDHFDVKIGDYWITFNGKEYTASKTDPGAWTAPTS
ncbi:MAG: prepilin-type N-terminal cleavage/methylation domain-containing protein [Coriobacteriales bacterium]|nr:prepilin-type N-terminal cleavage/methylation domain-containing protein [Coriobacteriales bacterium]